MFVSKKAIPRRMVLRGIGATLALPLLDSMVPAFSAFAATPAKPINRFGVVYVPNGMIMQNYLPTTEGLAYELTPTLSALAPFRARGDRHRGARRRRFERQRVREVVAIVEAAVEDDRRSVRMLGEDGFA